VTADLFFVSAEPSGDDLSVSVIQRIRDLSPSTTICAIGGSGLSRVDLKSPVDIAPLSVVGLFEGLKVYQKVVTLADEACDVIVRSGARVVVLVDSWGFSLRVAQRLKRRAPEIKLIKLVGPQVWATRPGRAKTLAETVDHLLCIHEAEVAFYEPYDLPCTVIGNPALDRVKPGNGKAFRERHNIPEQEDCLLVLPGSRRSEIERVAPTFADAVKRAQAQRERRTHIVVLVAEHLWDEVTASGLSWPEGSIFISAVDEKADAMAAADLAVACSGTVTTEVASQGCPMIVGYRLGMMTWLIAKVIFKSPYITLLNVAAKREVAKELVQYELTPDTLKTEILRLLNDPSARKEQLQAQQDALEAMGLGGEPAHNIAADVIIDYLKK
tara:strand:- start:7127 stop:8278 length:1152 start_codon:yes stop_codon:yes gene_type:complete